MLRRHGHVCSAAIWLLVLAGCTTNAPKPRSEISAEVEKQPRFPKPAHIRGIYVSAWSAGLTKKMEQIYGLLARTELNSIILDVRDAGHNYWKGMNLPLSDESGGTDVAIVHPTSVMDELAAHKIYPIARIACFRDRFVPVKHPERAVQNSKGGIWKDRAGYAWLDPYNQDNWEYIGQVVDFALDQGFPEIQLDYVRFPSEGSTATQVFPSKAAYSGENTSTDVVAAFARFIGDRVHKRKAVFGASIFGIVSINQTDQGIGQGLDKVSAPFDVISPMVYPSHFHRGEYGIANPNAQPYEIVSRSLGDYVRRLPGKPIRPWLQDFGGYDKAHIQAQILAAKELGYEDYQIWNARNNYVEAAYTDNSGMKGAAVAAPAGPQPKP